MPSKKRAGTYRQGLRDPHGAPEIPVGSVTAATRENERIVLTTLEKMLESEIDMQTTIIVGNAMTFAWQGFMVPPRGLRGKAL